jgi:hypothetical protein
MIIYSLPVVFGGKGTSSPDNRKGDDRMEQGHVAGGANMGDPAKEERNEEREYHGF